MTALLSDNRSSATATKLAGTNQYGLDVAFDTIDIDEKNMAVVIPFADGNRRDGVGDLLEVGGIDTSRHRMNPVVLFDHAKEVKLPIALAEDRNTKAYTVIVDPETRTARAQAFFYQGTGINGVDRDREYDHAVFCEQIFDLTAKRFIRGGSIGYQVISANAIPPDYERGIPAGQHLLRTLMLECSAVIMPCNKDTVRKMLAMPSICGKAPSPWLVKSLSLYAPENTKVVSGYEGAKSFRHPPSMGRDRESGLDIAFREMREEGKSDDEIEISLVNNHGADDREINKLFKKYGANYGADKKALYSGRGPVQAKYPEPLTAQDVLFAMNHGEEVTEQELADRLRKDKTELTRLLREMFTQGKLTARKTEGKLRFKLKALAGAKSLRHKYRQSAKGLRRRLKKSVSGSSVLRVRGKDLDSVRVEAEKKGLTFRWMETDGNAEKVKLSGDDGAIDELARVFGRPLKERAMAKKMKAKTKALLEDDIVDDVGGELPGDQPSPPPPDEGTDQAKEKYGAQCVRVIHEDFSQLMQDYDEMLQLLDNDVISAHLTKILERITGELDGLEELFDEAYSELEPLAGTAEEETEEAVDEEPVEEADEGEDTMDDAAVAADSEETVEPTPEEALEGMEKEQRKAKSLRGSVKSLRGKYKVYDEANVAKWGAQHVRDPETGIEYTRRVPRQGHGGERMGAGPGSRPMRIPKEPTTHVPKKALKALCPECEDAGKEECDCPGKVETKIAPLVAAGIGATVGGMLGGKDLSSVGEAASVLDEFSNTTSEQWNEEHRQKAYHYHKTLGGIAELEDVSDELEDGEKAAIPTPTDPRYPKGEATGGKPRPSATMNPADVQRYAGKKGMEAFDNGKPTAELDALSVKLTGKKYRELPDDGAEQDHVMHEFEKGNKALPGSPEWAEEEAAEPSHRQKIGEASSLFGDLARTRDFGDTHREKCAAYHKALNDVIEANTEKEEEEDDDDFEVGEIEEKAAEESRGRSGLGGTRFVEGRQGLAVPAYVTRDRVGGVKPERTGKGPGSRPLPIPKKPTRNVPQKGIKSLTCPECGEQECDCQDKTAKRLKKVFEQQDKILANLNDKLARIG